MSIECAVHGERESRFLCQHLTPLSRGLGFFIEADGQSGWCAACEEVWSQHEEWNATVEAQLGIEHVCDVCFATIRDANEA